VQRHTLTASEPFSSASYTHSAAAAAAAAAEEEERKVSGRREITFAGVN